MITFEMNFFAVQKTSTAHLPWMFFRGGAPGGARF